MYVTLAAIMQSPGGIREIQQCDQLLDPVGKRTIAFVEEML